MQKAFGFFGSNYLLFTALCAWAAAQVCKTLLDLILNGKLNLERMFGAGGMPSAHSALVCSLTMACARKYGVSSPWFAFAFVLAAIVMYDAMGVRHETGEQAKVINRIIEDWMTEEDEENPLGENGKKLKEKVGHTPLEVLSGALLGILIVMLIPAN